MRKIPSLFVRDWNGDRSRVTREVSPECQWVVDGEGTATRKRDGTACLILRGKLYRRYDAKHGKTPPPDFQPCEVAPDPKTGHWPGWIPVGDGPGDKWRRAAIGDITAGERDPWIYDGTWELCGPHFQTNAEGLTGETFYRHGSEPLPDCPRTFDGLAAYLREHPMEGVVWHHPDGRMAKIKARDFGIVWPRSDARMDGGGDDAQ